MRRPLRHAPQRSLRSKTNVVNHDSRTSVSMDHDRVAAGAGSGVVVTRPDPIRSKAREIVQAARRHHFKDAVDIAEASLRLLSHEQYMRGEKVGRGEALTKSIGGDEREQAA